MTSLIVSVFIIGYLLIALEHNIKINKASTALLLGVSCWVIYIMNAGELVHTSSGEFDSFLANNSHGSPKLFVELQLSHFLSEVSSILFFLLGAMTIVELIDAYQGFTLVTQKIQTTSKIRLLWLISIITFFLSAALDNLTTAIVMVSLLRKLIDDRRDRMFFASMVILAANAGGAWSPIGDVTTTMLWIAGKVTAAQIIKTLLIPSLACLIVPLLVLSFKEKGQITRPKELKYEGPELPAWERNLVFFIGIAGLLFVPVFKTITHLPPYMGILLSLAVLWIVTELLHVKKSEQERSSRTVAGVIRKIDTPSILFFLGILMAVGCLQSIGVLSQFAGMLDEVIGNENLIVMSIGLMSAVVDNVPLVAAGMGMYDFPVDHSFWEFLAYCAGTGGSALIIGSAAGVAVMGLEKIDFGWYFKNITWLALLGYFAGSGVYLALQ